MSIRYNTYKDEINQRYFFWPSCPFFHFLLLLLTLGFDLNLLDIPSVEQSYVSLSYRDFTSSLSVWTSYDFQNWPQNVK